MIDFIYDGDLRGFVAQADAQDIPVEIGRRRTGVCGGGPHRSAALYEAGE